MILGIDGARVRDWLSAMTDIDSLKDWNNTGQILFWIEMGNSWAHDRMVEIKVDEMEAANGDPRQMHQLRPVDRFVLADAFPSKRKLIMSREGRYDRSMTEG
jgi:hypothetical protein